MKSKLIKFSLLGSLFLVGCAGPTVSYVDPNAVTTLNTNFSQNDLRAVAQDMSTQLIQSGKMNQCKSFTISPVKNATDQYVDTEVMTMSMKDTLLNSSAVKSTYVNSINEAGNQADELARQNQSGMYDQSTTAKAGKMTGAQCRIDGKLTSDTQTNGKQTVVAYTFFVTVFNVQQGAAVFSSNKRISKGLSN